MASFNPVLTSQKRWIVLGRFNKRFCCKVPHNTWFIVKCNKKECEDNRTVSICFTQTPPTHFIKIKWAKDLSFCHTKRRKKRDDFLLPKSSLFFLKPWMNEQKISRILFVHPLKICEQYGFIQSCSYKSKASNRPRTIQQKK